MDVKAYLERIGYDGPTTPSAGTLAGLHLAHLLAVPFENLSIHAGEPVLLDPDWLFDKIVRRRRGGFCYEQNGLFAEVLARLGFAVELLEARVYDGDGRPGMRFDHLCLRVLAGGRAWLADVGFGDCFVRPLDLAESGEQGDGRRGFRIEPDGDERVLWDGDARAYRFALLPRALGDFEPGCRFHTTSPESPFTRRRVVSRLTPTGRITLRDDRLVMTSGGERSERPLSGDAEWRALAAEHFGVTS